MALKSLNQSVVINDIDTLKRVNDILSKGSDVACVKRRGVKECKPKENNAMIEALIKKWDGKKGSLAK